jgi:hypothetical protein
VATLNRAQMIDKVLQRLGVLGGGQAATAEDAALVGPVLDTVHTQRRKRGLANFATSAFPEWAQEPFAKVIAREAGPYFGLRSEELDADAREGELELAAQMQGRRHAVPVRFKDH